MLVTCCICGKKIEKDTAYKAKFIGPRSGKTTIKNCCSEQEWQAEEDRKKKAKEDKDKVYNLICDMWGYEIQNTKFFDEWSRWNKLQSNEIIYKYLRENETHLQQICDQPYQNESHRIMYFSKILKNTLKDFIPQPKTVTRPHVEQRTEVVAEEHYETKYRAKTRQALEDLEEDCDE